MAQAKAPVQAQGQAQALLASPSLVEAPGFSFNNSSSSPVWYAQHVVSGCHNNCAELVAVLHVLESALAVCMHVGARIFNIYCSQNANAGLCGMAEYELCCVCVCTQADNDSAEYTDVTV